MPHIDDRKLSNTIRLRRATLELALLRQPQSTKSIGAEALREQRSIVRGEWRERIKRRTIEQPRSARLTVDSGPMSRGHNSRQEWPRDPRFCNTVGHVCRESN
jgi:hypothetical protein